MSTRGSIAKGASRARSAECGARSEAAYRWALLPTGCLGLKQLCEHRADLLGVLLAAADLHQPDLALLVDHDHVRDSGHTVVLCEAVVAVGLNRKAVLELVRFGKFHQHRLLLLVRHLFH